jgi:D-3-phosphoglycerate dehydrogenase
LESVGPIWVRTMGQDPSVVGLGNIGGRLATKLRVAFDMRVLCYDPFLYPAGAQRYGAKLVDLPTLLKESDVISVHTLLSRGGPYPTYHLLGAKEFGMMKKTAVIVNTSRGAVIDQQALFEALKNGIIAGAGLDVFELEPISEDNPLIDLDNVVLTPHSSSSTYEAFTTTPVSAVENIIRFVEGKTPFWMVNPAALPMARAKQK